MPKKKITKIAADLRAEALRIEAEALKAERLKDAAKIPTCPTCGGRSFRIDTWTTVSQTAAFPEGPYEEDDDQTADDWAEDYEWEDYQSGDHTEMNESAWCNGCGGDVQEVLEGFGWTFYDDPHAHTAQPTTTEANAALNTLRRYFQGDASHGLLEELQGIADDIAEDDDKEHKA